MYEEDEQHAFDFTARLDISPLSRRNVVLHPCKAIFNYLVRDSVDLIHEVMEGILVRVRWHCVSPRWYTYRIRNELLVFDVYFIEESLSGFGAVRLCVGSFRSISRQEKRQALPRQQSHG
jgi:hypothetical protein